MLEVARAESAVILWSAAQNDQPGALNRVGRGDEVPVAATIIEP